MRDPHAVYDRTTALIVADVQNDFASRTGNLYVRGAERLIPLINEIASSMHAAILPRRSSSASGRRPADR